MLYEGGVRTPLYIRMPSVAPVDIDTPVMGHDLFPTIIECVGADASVEHDGVSLARALKGEAFERGAIHWHFPAYLEAYNRASEAEAREPERPFRTTPVGAIRDGRWKLLEYFEDGGLELYDLEEDPGERRDLADVHPERALQMRKQLQAWRAQMGAAMPTPKTVVE